MVKIPYISSGSSGLNRNTLRVGSQPRKGLSLIFIIEIMFLVIMRFLQSVIPVSNAEPSISKYTRL